MSKTAKEILAAARLPEHSVSICVRGDLVADIQALEDELARVMQEKASNGRLASGGKKQSLELAAQIEAKQAEMAEHTIPFRLRAIAPAKWRELVGKHPSPKDSTKLVDVVPFMGDALPLSVVSPELDAEDWARMLGGEIDGVEVEPVLPNAEIGKLMSAVWELNTEDVNVPKSLLASAVTRTTSSD